MTRLVLRILLFISSLLISQSIDSRKKEYKAEDGEEIFLLKYQKDYPLKIKTTSGKFFTIKIRGNPTTGYGWYLENPTQNKKFLKAFDLNEQNESIHYIPDKVPPGWTGGGGFYYFRFLALSSGEVTLIFNNKRPWDPNSSHTYSLNVIIK